MNTQARPATFTSQVSRLATVPKGKVANRLMTSSPDRDRVRTEPRAISEVDAKKAVPFWSDALICVSTTRLSRTITCRAQFSL